MAEVTMITCRLYISSKYHKELNKKSQELFTLDDYGQYYSEFPAPVEDNSYLGEYMIAYLEVAIIMNNPKYNLTPACDLKCELLKLGPKENVFNLLLSITYPNVVNVFHDILIFKEREQHLGFYYFELIGDQTMFSIEK